MNLKLAWRNIWRNKRRSLITIASITFAVFFSSLMLSTQLGQYERMIDNAVRFHSGYIQVMGKGYWDERTIDNSLILEPGLMENVNNTPHVDVAVPRIESFALVSYGEKTRGGMVIGTEPGPEDQLTRVRSRLVDGEFLLSSDKQVLVGQGLAKYFGLSVGDTLVLVSRGLYGANAAGLYPVKGIVRIPMPDLNNQLVYLPLEEAQWFFDAEERVTSLALVVDEPDHVERVLENLHQEFSAEKYDIMGWREMMPELVQSIEFDYVSGVILMYILYAVIGFGIFGTFLMMTNERIYEFGILISIGMKRFRLQQVVMVEVVIMGILGALCGILISLPIIYYLYQNPIYISGDYEMVFEQFGIEPVIPFAIDAVIFYRQAIIVVVMSMLIGLYPLFKILHLNTARAIRA
jgi:putative ABC transport system permease protein